MVSIVFDKQILDSKFSWERIVSDFYLEVRHYVNKNMWGMIPLVKSENYFIMNKFFSE